MGCFHGNFRAFFMRIFAPAHSPCIVRQVRGASFRFDRITHQPALGLAHLCLCVIFFRFPQTGSTFEQQ